MYQPHIQIKYACNSSLLSKESPQLFINTIFFSKQQKSAFKGAIIQHTKCQAVADVTENRLLHIAIEVINAAVKAAQTMHVLQWKVSKQHTHFIGA